MRKTWTFLMTILVALAAANGRADSASMTLEDGTRFAFELVKSAGQARTHLASGVVTGQGVGYRVLFDRKRHRFFGYTVKGTSLPKGGFRLELGPLTPDVLARLARDFTEDHGDKMVGEPLAIEYPPPQEVRDDEPLMLELLVNPATGEKLSDVIRVTSSQKAPPEPDRLAMKRAVLKINGKVEDSESGMSGRYIYFVRPEYGRFVLSTEAVSGYDFVPAELVSNRTIRFTAAGDAYEWTSAEPIVQTAPVLEQLWVWHDLEYPAGRSGIGAMSGLPRR